MPSATSDRNPSSCAAAFSLYRRRSFRPTSFCCSAECNRWNVLQTDLETTVKIHYRRTQKSRQLIGLVFSRQSKSGGSLCTRSCLSVRPSICVAVCVCASISCKQVMPKANLWIFAKFITDTPYILPWKWITFGAVTFKMAGFQQH